MGWGGGKARGTLPGPGSHAQFPTVALGQPSTPGCPFLKEKGVATQGGGAASPGEVRPRSTVPLPVPHWPHPPLHLLDPNASGRCKPQLQVPPPPPSCSSWGLSSLLGGAGGRGASPHLRSPPPTQTAGGARLCRAALPESELGDLQRRLRISAAPAEWGGRPLAPAQGQILAPRKLLGPNGAVEASHPFNFFLFFSF